MLKRGICVFMSVLMICFVLLSNVSAQTSVSEEIRKLTYYAQEFETGNINYMQLVLYLSSVRESLNEALGAAGKEEGGGILTESQVESVLGNPQEYTKWAWVEKEEREKKLEVESPIWRKAVFDGSKIQIRLNAHPSVVGESENIMYRLNFEIVFKKSDEQLNIKKDIEKIKSLAESFNKDPSSTNAEALAKESVNAEKKFNSYFMQSSTDCNELMDSIFGSENKRETQQLIVQEFALAEGDDFEAKTRLQMCDECEWNWINLDMWVEKREPGSKPSDEMNGMISNENFKDLSTEEFRSRTALTVDEIKKFLEAEDFKSAGLSSNKLKSITEAWNQKANDIWSEVDREFKAEWTVVSEAQMKEFNDNYGWIKQEQEKMKKIKELTKNNYEERKSFYTLLFSAYNPKESYFVQEEYELRLVEEFKEFGKEVCNNNIDDNNDGATDCADGQCGGKVCGETTVDYNNESREVEMFCIQKQCTVKEQLDAESVWSVCGNHICEVGENESCATDCAQCLTYDALECNGDVIFSGVDENSCPLQPICLEQTSFCNVSEECSQPLCGKAECVENTCKVIDLEECREAECRDGEERVKQCNSGDEIIISVCRESLWKETGLDCEDATEGTGEISEKPVVGGSCEVKSDCGGENDVCSNGICVTIPQVEEIVDIIIEQDGESEEGEQTEEVEEVEIISGGDGTEQGSQEGVQGEEKEQAEEEKAEQTEQQEQTEQTEQVEREEPQEEQQEEPQEEQSSSEPESSSEVTGSAIIFDSFKSFLANLFSAKSITGSTTDDSSDSGDSSGDSSSDSSSDSGDSSGDSSSDSSDSGDSSGDSSSDSSDSGNEPSQQEPGDGVNNIEPGNEPGEGDKQVDFEREINEGEKKRDDFRERENEDMKKREAQEKERCNDECDRACYDSKVRPCVDKCIREACGEKWECDVDSLQEKCESSCGKENSAEECKGGCIGKCMEGGDWWKEFNVKDESPDQIEKGVFKAGGSCRKSQGVTEASIFFDGWGEPFNQIQSLKYKYYNGGNSEWCKIELENLQKQRKEFENGFNEEFVKWFFEKYLANSAEDWNKQVSGIFEVYWKDVDISRETAYRMNCLDISELADYKLISVKYESNYGYLEFWEEVKSVKLQGIEREVQIVSPYMKIWVFPPKEFIKYEMKNAMAKGEMPGPTDKESDDELTEEEKKEIKKDKSLIKEINEFSEKYGENVVVQFKDYNTSEIVFNLYLRINEEEIISIEPMLPSEVPSQDVLITLDFENFYEIIYLQEKEMRGTELESPPWDKKSRSLGKVVKDMVNGGKMYFKTKKMIDSAKIEPESAEKDVEFILELFFEKSMGGNDNKDMEEQNDAEQKK